MRTTAFDSSILRTGLWKSPNDGPLTTIDLQHPDGVAFLLVSADLSCPDSGRGRRLGARDDAGRIPRARRRSDRGNRGRSPHLRLRRAVLRARPVEHSTDPLLSDVDPHDSRLRAMDGPRSRPKSPTFPMRSFGRSKRLDGLTVRQFLSHLVVAACLSRDCLFEHRRDLLEKWLTAQIDDVDVLCAGTSNQSGRARERIGKTACFLNRDDRVVRSVDHGGRATNVRGRFHRARADRSAFRPVCRRGGQPAVPEFSGTAAAVCRRTAAVEATRSTIGASSTRASARGSRAAARSAMAAPIERPQSTGWKRHAAARSAPSGRPAHQATPGCLVPRGRRTSNNALRSGRGRENRARRHSSRIGSTRPRGMPRALATSLRIRAARARSAPWHAGPGAGNQRATRRDPSLARATIESASFASAPPPGGNDRAGRDRSVWHDERPGPDLDHGQEQAGESPPARNPIRPTRNSGAGASACGAGRTRSAIGQPGRARCHLSVADPTCFDLRAVFVEKAQLPRDRRRSIGSGSAPRRQVRRTGIPSRSIGASASLVAELGGRWLATTSRGLAHS